MVRKKLAIAILALSALQANVADAMGLGNLSIKSALNQPLNAEIRLLDLGDLDPTQIKIQLATPEDFQRAGVDRDFFLTNLRFNVDMDGHGGGTIKVTTREPVVEPYLNFVIEARWPNGRLLREFAVLLDPPTFSANKAAAPVTPAMSTGGQTAKRRAVQPPAVNTEAAPESTAASSSAADMSLPKTGKTDEYRIQVYDTLSKIAARFKPAGDVSVAQTMLAIQRVNPNVFIHNNVNLIKSGYVLRLPSADEARSITADQATQEVDKQTSDWRGARSSGSAVAQSTAAGPQLDASAPAPSKNEGGYHEQARLSIATAGDTDKNAKGGGGSGKGLNALRQQLTESQESLEKGKRDNKELQSRLDDMDRQMATLQRLISLKDDQLAALQAKSGVKTAPQATAQSAPTATPATTTTAASTVATAAAPTTVPPATAGAPAATTAPNNAASVPSPVATPVPHPKPAPVVKKPAPAVDPLGVRPVYYLYGAITALLVGIIAIVVGKRRKVAEDAELDALEIDPHDDFQFDSDALDNADDEDVAAVAVDETAPENYEAEQSVIEAPKKTARSETGDPIAESDIYIAYGRYQQAVDLLTHAIDAEPARSDLRVKLLEVYVEMRNKEAFGQQFVALQSLGDSSAIAHVKDFLSSVDGVSNWLDDLPLAANTAFAATAVDTASAIPDLDLDLDFDDDLTSNEITAPHVNPDTSFVGDETEAEEEFDLNLDDELTSTEADFSENLRTDSAPESNFDAGDFEAPSFETRGVAASSFGSVKVDDSGLSELDENGLDLDLGDDDLDQALSRMDDSGNLGDLEDMSNALDAEPSNTSLDLEAGLDDLPEEFDLSQPQTELPEVGRVADSDLNDLSFSESSLEVPSFTEDLDELSFEEPSVEELSVEELRVASTAAPRSEEMDVFAGLSQPASTPVSESEEPIAATPTLDGGDDFDFLADADEVATKLDLARAYIDMGDTDGAKDILDEVMQEGTDTQKQEASTLLGRMS